MQSELFILWLKGFLDACGEQPTVEQIAVIKAKIGEVAMRGPFRDMALHGALPPG